MSQPSSPRKVVTPDIEGHGPAPVPTPPHAGPGRGALLTVFGLVLGIGIGVGAGVTTALKRPTGDLPIAAGVLKVADDTVEMAASAPQLHFLTMAVAANEAPLPPMPAPAKVLVDESRAAPIFAPMSGRVEQVLVQLGQRVKPGDKLLSIRSSDLPELNREVETARAQLAVKSAALERIRDLVNLKAVPEKDLLAAEGERHEVELALQAAEGKRRSLRLGHLDDSGLYWVTASKAGNVVERRALVGMEVGPDRAEPLLEIADLNEVVVVAYVIENDTAGLQVGQTAEVNEASLSAPVTGTIEYIAELVDPARRTVAVRVRTPNRDHKLHPNAYAQVTFKTNGAPRIIVPGEAVVTDDQDSVVFVKTQAQQGGAVRLQRREVKLGRTREDRTEILSGLNAGETYVARGALLILNTIDLAK